MNGGRESRRNRRENLAIFLLALTAVLLFSSLPLFGALSDRSLLQLFRERLRQSPSAVAVSSHSTPPPVFPVRIVYANDFARLSTDTLTTLSEPFEHAGTFLAEALGSAGSAVTVPESIFFGMLRQEGLYFDFTAPVNAELLSALLGVRVPKELEDVRRMLLLPVSGERDAMLYVQDGARRSYRFPTAVSSAALRDFLASQSGSSAGFAGLLGPDYAHLSPYTLVVDAPGRPVLSAANILPGSEDELLRRAEFNPHTENRFTESTGTVIVREVSSTLYLRPDGTVRYLGGEVPQQNSVYYVPAAAPGAPTLAEAASAAQNLALALLQDLTGDTEIYLSQAEKTETGYSILFDLMSNGTPIRYTDGSHAASVTIEGARIVAFSVKARCYTPRDEAALLLPFAQAAAIAGTWEGAELVAAYADSGADTVTPVWLAE